MPKKTNNKKRNNAPSSKRQVERLVSPHLSFGLKDENGKLVALFLTESDRNHCKMIFEEYYGCKFTTTTESAG